MKTQGFGFSRNKKIRDHQILMLTFGVILVLTVPIAITAWRYIWYSFRCIYTEIMGYNVNWEPITNSVSAYNKAQAAKVAFIEGNRLAKFYSSLNGGFFMKLIQFILIFASAFLPVIFYKLADNHYKAINRIRARIRRKQRH